MTERSPYSLDSVQLEKAVQALQKAAETLRPNPSETRLYRLLRICVRVAIAALAGIVLAVVLWFVAGVMAESSVALAFFSYVMFFFAGIFAFLFLLAAVGAPVFVLLNQSIVRQAFQQQRLLKKLGIRELSLSAWRLQRRGQRWSRLRGTVLTWGGIVSLVLGLLGEIPVGIAMSADRGRGINGPNMFFGFLFGLFFVFGVTVLVWKFVQRSREQWAIVADANRLRSTLESMRAKAGAGEAVAIPAAVVEHAAQIERVLIARERRNAVVASAGTTDHGYGILVGRAVSSQKGSLDPRQRVAVEDLFENLSSNPRPPGVEQTPEGLLGVTTSEGGVELQYSVDEGAKRVHIVALTTHHYG